jgi:hypothetical protein
MTKEKWQSLYNQNISLVPIKEGPEGWEETRKGLVQLIEQTDRDTEVYFLENTKRKELK